MIDLHPSFCFMGTRFQSLICKTFVYTQTAFSFAWVQIPQVCTNKTRHMLFEYVTKAQTTNAKMKARTQRISFGRVFCLLDWQLVCYNNRQICNLLANDIYTLAYKTLCLHDPNQCLFSLCFLLPTIVVITIMVYTRAMVIMHLGATTITTKHKRGQETRMLQVQKVHRYDNKTHTQTQWQNIHDATVECA